MELEIINKALAEIDPPPLNSATPTSAGQTESQTKCEEPTQPTPTICRSCPSESAVFRENLFGLDESHHPKVEKLAKTGEWFTRSCSHNDASNGKALMLSGDPGTGKTHVARAIYRYIGSFGVDICFLHKGKHPAPLWIDWPRVAELEKQSDFEDVLYEVEQSRVLFLDDIGSESDRFKTGIPASRLRVILSRSETKWILATTNFSREALNNTYDARVADRFKAFRWLSLAGVPSYRGK